MIIFDALLGAILGPLVLLLISPSVRRDLFGDDHNAS